MSHKSSSVETWKAKHTADWKAQRRDYMRKTESKKNLNNKYYVLSRVKFYSWDMETSQLSNNNNNNNKNSGITPFSLELHTPTLNYLSFLW